MHARLDRVLPSGTFGASSMESLLGWQKDLGEAVVCLKQHYEFKVRWSWLSWWRKAVILWCAAGRAARAFPLQQ